LRLNTRGHLNWYIFTGPFVALLGPVKSKLNSNHLGPFKISSRPLWGF